MSWKILIIAAAFSLIAGCGGSDEAPPVSSDDTPPPVEDPVSVEEYAIGDDIELWDSFSASILEVKTQQTAGAIIADTELYLTRPAEGMTFAVVEYTLANNGAVEEYFLLAPQLADAEGNLFDYSIDATANYSVQELVRTEPEDENPNYNSASTYSPGEYKTKAVVFEVDPAAWEAGGWTLVLEDSGVVRLN